MTVGRKLKRNVFIDTDIDCQNCGCWQRVCTWNGECDNLEPMTNEEWFCGLSTEEKAKWIAEEKMCRGYFIFPSMEEAIQDALEWLKEKHEE